LKVPRILAYVVGLIILAFALGSLTRGTPGGSLLFRSYWLLYLLYLGPVAIIGLMVVLIIVIGLNYRQLGGALGYGVAKRRQARRGRSRYSTFVSMFFWALAIGVLVETKGSIFNPRAGDNSTIAQNIVGGTSTPPNPLQIAGFLPALTNLIQTPWFSLAFLGLLIVGGVVLIESYRVSLKETHDLTIQHLKSNQEQGWRAVQESIKLVQDNNRDPRDRIIDCYQHLVTTVSRLGAYVSSDLTARELERAVRSTFALKGQSITELTQLFEEARYSLHVITDNDAAEAHRCLESVAKELEIQLAAGN
jgi:Domain of unknown function (DUF4129)